MMDITVFFIEYFVHLLSFIYILVYSFAYLITFIVLKKMGASNIKNISVNFLGLGIYVFCVLEFFFHIVNLVR
jgi:hypothetical protein